MAGAARSLVMTMIICVTCCRICSRRSHNGLNCTHLGAVQGIKVEVVLILGIQSLNVKVIFRVVAVVYGVDEVMRRMAVAHLELPCRLRLVIGHELDTCGHMRTFLPMTLALVHMLKSMGFENQCKGLALEASCSQQLLNGSPLLDHLIEQNSAAVSRTGAPAERY